MSSSFTTDWNSYQSSPQQHDILATQPPGIRVPRDVALSHHLSTVLLVDDFNRACCSCFLSQRYDISIEASLLSFLISHFDIYDYYLQELAGYIN